MNTKQRTVMLKTSVSTSNIDTNKKAIKKEPVHINLVSMGDQIPDAEDYGIKNTEHKKTLNNVLQYISKIDETFFQWLEADAKNAILFVNNPIKALKTAIPNFDESVFSALNKKMFR